jgi:hypothetical protein
MEGEIKLRSIQSMMLFLAISKHGRMRLSPQKRQSSGMAQFDIMSKLNSSTWKQYGIQGMDRIILKQNSNCLGQSIENMVMDTKL